LESPGALVNKKIDTINQFGEKNFIVLREYYLLVPTQKVDWPPKSKNGKPVFILHPCDL
jgi:hypothetical protein